MKFDVGHVARLANLPLSKKELVKLEGELGHTLENIERLKEVDTSKIEGTNEVNNLMNVWREDVASPSLSQAEALMNAKKTHRGFFVVPAILEGCGIT